ncbi:MAG: hypothetical protein ACK5LO_17255 [Leucobacter sp.]
MALAPAATAATSDPAISPSVIPPEALAPVCLPSPAAAQYIGRQAKTLANWRAEGIGPRCFRSGGKRSTVYYLVSDLDAWVADQAERFALVPAGAAAAKAGE